MVGFTILQYFYFMDLGKPLFRCCYSFQGVEFVDNTNVLEFQKRDIEP